MAIDERQTTGIREGAGREESKYNLEFIDFLQRWGTPLLLVAALITGGMLAWRFYKERKTETLDNAFVEYEAASGVDASPDALIAVADQFSNVKSVSLLARLDAADAYLQSVRSGAKPGARFKADDTFEDPADAMTPDDRTDFLSKAETQFNAVFAATEDDRSRQMFATGALFGLAAVAESREKFDEAKVHYERVIAIASGSSLNLQAEMAKERIASLDSLKSMPPLLSRADLPKPPEPPAPPAASGPPEFSPTSNIIGPAPDAPAADAPATETPAPEATPTPAPTSTAPTEPVPTPAEPGTPTPTPTPPTPAPAPDTTPATPK